MSRSWRLLAVGGHPSKWQKYRDGARMMIPAGSLDEDPGSRPQVIVRWGSRAHWYRESGDMEKHETTPG